MLDYIINESCDEKRVVDVVHVGQAQRYGKLIELKTPWTHQDHAKYNSSMIEWEGLKSFTKLFLSI